MLFGESLFHCRGQVTPTPMVANVPAIAATSRRSSFARYTMLLGLLMESHCAQDA